MASSESASDNLPCQHVIDECGSTSDNPTTGRATTCSDPCKRTPQTHKTAEDDHPPCPESPLDQTCSKPVTDCCTKGLKGYGRPVQHPLYQTTNSKYGQHIPPPALILKRKAFSSKFTRELAIVGPYIDSHFTNSSDKEYLYQPPTYYY